MILRRSALSANTPPSGDNTIVGSMDKVIISEYTPADPVRSRTYMLTAKRSV